MLSLPKKLFTIAGILLFFFILGFFQVEKAHAATNQSVWDFDPQKYFDNKLKDIKAENDPTNPIINVSVDRVIPKTIDTAMFSVVENIAPSDPRLASGNRHAIPALAHMMGSMYANPPASGLAYVQYELANAGLLAQPSYAQGIGFAGLLPLLPLWKTTRNISYSVLIIIMIAIGFMIIFRTKIDPKTVISVQAALPRIVFTLIIITFSYPIVGFMIDLMYLAMAIVINLLATGLSGVQLPPGLESLNNTATQQTEFMTGGWGKLFGSVFNLSMIGPFFQQLLGGSKFNTGIFTFASIIGFIIPAAISGVVALPSIAGLLGPTVIILFILFLGLLFTFIRLTFLLLNSYIQVLLALILGPILLLKEAIPGQSAVKEWLQNILANLVVFPATVFVIYGSWILTAIAWKSSLWGAPLIPAGGGGEMTDGNPLAILMGLGTIFLAPNLVASIKKAFHPKPSLPITAGSAFAPITGGAQTAMGAASQFYYMQQIVGERGPFGWLAGKMGGGGGSAHGTKKQ